MPIKYESRASEADDAARKATTAAERETYLKVATLWRELAARKAAKQRPQ